MFCFCYQVILKRIDKYLLNVSLLADKAHIYNNSHQQKCSDILSNLRV